MLLLEAAGTNDCSFYTIGKNKFPARSHPI